MIRKESFLVLAMGLAFNVWAGAQQTTPSGVTAQIVNHPAETMQAKVFSGAVLRLEDVVRAALAANPAIQAGVHATAAQRAKVPQAKALPDPNFSIGWAGNIQPFSVQTGDPSSYRSVNAMQMLPFPGKRGLRGQIAAKEADASQWDLESVRRRIAADVKAAYYDYWFYDKAIQTAQRNRDLLMKLTQISEARYRAGKGMQGDVLRSQVETSMLLQKLTTLEQQRATAAARINTLLARNPDTPLPPAAGIPQHTVLNYSLEELYKLARQGDPEYQKMQKMVERNQLAISLARKDYLPDLTVGYMYQQRPSMPDMHGMTFTVNVPVFYKSKQREEIRQATEEELSAVSARDNRQNELYFDLKQNYLAAKASENLLKLFAQGVVPQSSLALESSMASYRVGTADFTAVLANFTTVLNYETEYYRELANYQTALARMEALTGADLSTEEAVANTSAQAAPHK
jgi:cobalt-zinc-cadmium efflux system outer membrane protein